MIQDRKETKIKCSGCVIKMRGLKWWNENKLEKKKKKKKNAIQKERIQKMKKLMSFIYLLIPFRRYWSCCNNKNDYINCNDTPSLRSNIE